MFPGRHPQEHSPEPSELMEALRHKYPNHEYFTQPSIPSDRSIVSIGKMLYPDKPAANFFPSNVTKPIEPTSRAHEKFRSPVKSTPLSQTRVYYPHSVQSQFTATHGPSSFSGAINPPKGSRFFWWYIHIR